MYFLFMCVILCEFPFIYGNFKFSHKNYQQNTPGVFYRTSKTLQEYNLVVRFKIYFTFFQKSEILSPLFAFLIVGGHYAKTKDTIL